MVRLWALLFVLLWPLTAHAQYENLADNTARDLGAYACTEPVGAHSNPVVNATCKTIAGYGGWAVDTVNSVIYMFGGGHDQTAATTMMKFNPVTKVWASDSGVSTPCTDMIPATNFDPTNAWWISTQQPMSSHTYSALQYFPTQHLIARLRPGIETGSDCTPQGQPGFGSGMVIHEYNTVTHAWQKTAAVFEAMRHGVADYDPPSGLGISIGASVDQQLRTYDATTKALTTRKNFFSVGDLGYDESMVYYPPNQKHYLFDRLHRKVWELTLDRTTWANSTLVDMGAFVGTYPNTATGGGEYGYDYDSDNQIICGAVYNGTVSCFKPETKTWTTQTITREAGSIANIGSAYPMHMFTFLPAHHAFFFMSASSALNMNTNRMWAYRLANVATPPPPATIGAMTIYNTSGATETNRIVSFNRPFKQADIAACAHATINGTAVLTQCNATGRWTDGSLKLAQISFIIPTIAAGGHVDIGFYSDPTCNDTGGETKANMLANYDFEGSIQMTGTGAVLRTISARAMLTADKYRVWLQGPIVTAVIIEDRTTAQSFDTDFGDASKSLHPIFEAWFYPQGNKVDLGYTVENMWSSTNPARAMRSLTYSLALLSGNASPTTRLSQASFIHILKSRWHKRYWIGSDPPAIRIDHNLAYLVTTRAIPNYDTAVVPTESLIASFYSGWLNNACGDGQGRPCSKTLDGNAIGIGSYSKDLGAAGINAWIGLMNTWDVLYLYSMGSDDRMLERVMGNADLAGRIPWHYREADTLAGQGDKFDVPTTGTVDTFGRVISLNARKTVNLSFPSNPQCGGGASALDTISVSSNIDGWILSRTHMPSPAMFAYLLTGRYYYLEELQFTGAFVLAGHIGCLNPATEESGHWGDAGYINDGEARGDAWGFREVAYAAFFSPDGTPEKDYFESKLKNNIAEIEGVVGQAISDPTRQAHWTHGATNRRLNPAIFGTYGIPPLGEYHRDTSGFLGAPLIPASANILSAGATPFEQFFVTVAMGVAKDFGYPTQGLLHYLGRFPINLMMNPTANKYDIQMYRLPTTKVTPREWVQTYADLDNYWGTTCEADNPTAHCPPTAWGTNQLTTFDHSYTMIARAALSFLADLTVDGYSGLTAYNKIVNEAPGQNPTTGSFATSSPKWAIIARTDVIPPVIPPVPPPGPSRADIGGTRKSGGTVQ